jgi:hypothetical protein
MDRDRALSLAREALQEKVRALHIMVELETRKGNQLLVENFQAGIEQLNKAIEVLA